MAIDNEKFIEITTDRREKPSLQLNKKKGECPMPFGTGTLRVKRTRVIEATQVEAQTTIEEFVSPNPAAVSVDNQTEKGGLLSSAAVAGEVIQPRGSKRIQSRLPFEQALRRLVSSAFRK